MRGRYGQYGTVGGVDIIYLPSIWRRRTATLNKGLFDFCEEELPTADVVHIFGIYDLLGPVAATFARDEGVPYLVETMGMFAARGRSRFAKQLYHRVAGRRLVRRAERIVVSSEQERTEVTSRGVPERQIVVRRNPVNAPQGPHDREHLAEAVSRLGIDEELRQEPSVACAAVKATPDWKEPLDQLELLYHDLLAGRVRVGTLGSSG